MDINYSTSRVVVDIPTISTHALSITYTFANTSHKQLSHESHNKRHGNKELSSQHVSPALSMNSLRKVCSAIQEDIQAHFNAQGFSDVLIKQSKQLLN